ncbi:MAG: hypothetical protein JNJ41_12690 [Bacteroidia bacterium]|nr:hypothetical protein [Bacteroidia bacterium]
MKKIISLIILVVVTSCDSLDKNAALTKESVTQKHADSASTLLKDSIVSPDNTADTVVTKRLLSFVNYLDSIGFNCDSNRIKKLFGRYSKSPRFTVKNHFFYSATPATSGLSYYFNYFAKNKKDNPDWRLDTVTIKSCKSIVWYFFSELTPDKTDNEKWYTDAIIEEWKFKNSSSAKTSAEEIGRMAPRLYFNVGAFVCHIDNYMYIITSRSSGSMWTLRKPVFKTFATRNKVTVTNIDKWY